MVKIFTFGLLVFFMRIALASAVSKPETPTETIPTGPTSAAAFVDLLNNLVNWLFVVVLVGSVAFLVLAGWQFISAGGEPQAVSQARTKLLWAVIGILVAVLSKGIVTAVKSLVIGT